MLQARVYLYMGNYEKAEAAARVVVNQESFTFTPESEISTTDVASKNYVFSQELVFALYNSDLQSLYTESFTPDNGLYMLEETYESLYETDVYGAFTDYRYVYQTELQSNVRLSTKLKQPTGGNAFFLEAYSGDAVERSLLYYGRVCFPFGDTLGRGGRLSQYGAHPSRAYCSSARDVEQGGNSR